MSETIVGEVVSESAFGRVHFDAAAGVATLVMQMPGRANTIDQTFIEGLGGALDRIQALDGLRGIIVASGHKDFCAGANIDMLYQARDAAAFYAATRTLGALFRRLETGGVPVVAALTGSALGGGYELALACHHRIALDDARVQVGLPEVSLGVIPGGGATQRLPRLVGLQPAMEMILQGQSRRAPKALQAGFVDALAPDAEALFAQARAYIAEHPKAQQPWDQKGFRWKGPRPGTDDARGLFMGAAAMLYKKAAGAVPAPEMALRAIQEGMGLSFDRALEVEARYFTHVAVSDTAKDMIRTLWYHRGAAERHEGLPSVADPAIARVAILGAGMMGAGLAWVAASKGYEVIVKDIAEAALERGRAHCAEQATTRGKHLGAEGQQAILARIAWTLDDAALAGVDLVIEAVVENDEVKAKVTRAVEAVMSPAGIFASNTSAIPITHLAQASVRRDRFIGLHFFSPVEQMPLVEIVMGADTSEDTLARSLAFIRRIGKLPIVVNDGYGFFTSRVFGAYLMESVELVAEGHDPVLIEQAARAAGMAVPPLKVFDEVSLSLGEHAMAQRRKFAKDQGPPPAGLAVLAKLAELGRMGKASGKGFYEYEGRTRHLWPGLRELASGTPARTGLELIRDRLMYAQIAEVGRALEDGVVRQYRDAEVGAIFGIGFAPATGGPLSWMDRRGLPRVVADLRALADTVGTRYTPAPILVRMAERGERFFPAV
ncbi:MAG: enoyl-CoA hydratase/isomerase family protein [Deltaproteobacteria bacterium]|nr:enoyl-CoA hydratase/isomerase family protein [Deltaproteobacteria bacterium]MCB9788957.1 enoyl-CoA hydratase/isomerase family protein [Deltaproteobacteria bacterium]